MLHKTRLTFLTKLVLYLCDFKALLAPICFSTFTPATPHEADFIQSPNLDQLGIFPAIFSYLDDKT